MWQGPAPADRTTSTASTIFPFLLGLFRGQQTNFGAHHLDIAQWGLGMDDSGPVAIDGKATFNKDGWFETPETANITYTYASGIPLNCTLGKGHPEGTTFLGEKGKIWVNRGKLEVTLNGEKVKDPISWKPAT